jgi:hypothetical protein
MQYQPPFYGQSCKQPTLLLSAGTVGAGIGHCNQMRLHLALSPLSWKGGGNARIAVLTRRDKLVARLRARPKDFTWDELVRLLAAHGYSEARPAEPAARDGVSCIRARL